MHRYDATTVTEKEFRRLCGHRSKTKVDLKTRLLEKIKSGLTKILKLIFNRVKFDPLRNKKETTSLLSVCELPSHRQRKSRFLFVVLNGSNLTRNMLRLKSRYQTYDYKKKAISSVGSFVLSLKGYTVRSGVNDVISGITVGLCVLDKTLAKRDL